MDDNYFDVALNLKDDRWRMGLAIAAVVGSSLPALARSMHGQPDYHLTERILDAIMPWVESNYRSLANEWEHANHLAEALRAAAPDHELVLDHDYRRTPMAST